MKTHFFLFYSVLAIFFAGCQKEIGQTTSSKAQRMEPDEKYCSKIIGLSAGLAEIIARDHKVAISSITFLRAEAYGINCSVVVDTQKGPKSCSGVWVYSDGKEFWAGGGCF
jgi:hypothetical protein